MFEEVSRIQLSLLRRELQVSIFPDDYKHGGGKGTISGFRDSFDEYVEPSPAPTAEQRSAATILIC